jgi:hypothetical protein
MAGDVNTLAPETLRLTGLKHALQQRLMRTAREDVEKDANGAPGGGERTSVCVTLARLRDARRNNDGRVKRGRRRRTAESNGERGAQDRRRRQEGGA